MDPIGELAATAGAVLGSLALGAAKKYTGVLDGRIGEAIKPAQPLLVLGAAVLLPWLGQQIGVVPPDPQQFLSAPTATVLTIAAREGLRRWTGGKRGAP